jgi:hypothetical protein
VALQVVGVILRFGAGLSRAFCPAEATLRLAARGAGPVSADMPRLADRVLLLGLIYHPQAVNRVKSACGPRVGRVPTESESVSESVSEPEAESEIAGLRRRSFPGARGRWSAGLGAVRSETSKRRGLPASWRGAGAL